MNLTWHIARKDFRHLRFYLAGWLGLMVIMQVLSGIDPLPEGPIDIMLYFWSGLLKVVKIFLLSLIVSRLVHADPPVGNTAFWLSRPLSGRKLLLGKSLFIVVFLILPTLLVEFLFLRVYGVTAYDILRSVPQLLFWQLLYISILMMLAALTRSLPRMIVLGLFVFVAIPWVCMTYPMVLPHLVTRPELLPPLTLSTSKWIGFSLGLLSVAGIVVWQQYITRRTAISGILLVAAVFVSCALPWVWSWDFVGRLQEVHGDVLDVEQVATRIDEQSLTLDQDGQGRRLMDGQMILQGRLVLGNIPYHLVVVPERVVSTPSFREKRRFMDEHRNPYVPIEVPEWESTRTKPPVHQARLESMSTAVGGARFLDAEPNVHAKYLPDLLSISDENYQRHGGRATDLVVDVDFLVQNDQFATIQLAKGGRYDGGSDHARILEVEFGKHNVSIELEESRHRLVHDHIKSRQYFLHNKARREALLGEESDFSLGGFFFDSVLPPMSYFPVMLKITRTTLSFELPSESVPAQQDWFQDAELVRVGTDTRGRFSKSVRLDDVVFQRIPRS